MSYDSELDQAYTNLDSDLEKDLGVKDIRRQQLDLTAKLHALNRTVDLKKIDLARSRGLVIDDLVSVKARHPGATVHEFSIGGGMGGTTTPALTVRDGNNITSYYQCIPCGGGWVKGEPEERPYDNMVHMAGSKGVNYFCRLCQKGIACRVHAVS